MYMQDETSLDVEEWLWSDGLIPPWSFGYFNDNPEHFPCRPWSIVRLKYTWDKVPTTMLIYSGIKAGNQMQVQVVPLPNCLMTTA